MRNEKKILPQRIPDSDEISIVWSMLVMALASPVLELNPSNIRLRSSPRLMTFAPPTTAGRA